MADQLKIMEAFLAKLEEDTVTLMAKASVRIDYDKPLGTKLMFLFIRTPKIKGGDLKAAETKLKKEIEESKTTSQKEIEEVLKKNGLI